MINDTSELLDKLTKAVSFKYKGDKTAPGITISSLKNGQYYCSIVRYSGAFAKGKEVVCSAKGSDLFIAIRDAAQSFLSKATITRDPLQELNSIFEPVKPYPKVVFDKDECVIDTFHLYSEDRDF
jgi:hypothetical protein